MKRSLTVAFALCVASASIPAFADGSYEPFVGQWTCRTAAQSTVNAEFALIDDGAWLRFEEQWRNDDAHGAFTNFYFRDRTDRWRTASYGSNGWTYSAASDGWKAKRLEFDGVENTDSGYIHVREHFTVLSDTQFEHGFDLVQKDGTGQPISREICNKKAIGAARASFVFDATF